MSAATQRTVSDPEVDGTHLAELVVILSQCFDEPDASFVEAVHTGTFHTTLTDRTEPLGIDVPQAPVLDDLQTARVGYRRSFEGYDGPSAPPVESVYKPWHDGQHRELLSGPPAMAMKRTLREADIEIPERHPPDHLVVLLEFASLLLTAETLEAAQSFWETHLDWIPAFEQRVKETSDEPFYRWATTVLARVVAAIDAFLVAQTTEQSQRRHA